MTNRERELLRKVSERWSRFIGYKTVCDHPTEQSIAFLHERLVWLVEKLRGRRDEVACDVCNKPLGPDHACRPRTKHRLDKNGECPDCWGEEAKDLGPANAPPDQY